jgi:hypothetical protein
LDPICLQGTCWPWPIGRDTPRSGHQVYRAAIVFILTDKLGYR